MADRASAAELIRATKGDLYDANFDTSLIAARNEAKDLCFDYNYGIRPSETNKQQALLKALLGKVGAGVTVVAPFWCDYGSNIQLGENTFLNHNTVMLDGAPITLGKRVFALSITICDDVWIGAGVMILPGVTIGRGSVIGAGSVVNKDIPAGVVAVGCPCRVIRTITNKDAEMGQLWKGSSR